MPLKERNKKLIQENKEFLQNNDFEKFFKFLQDYPVLWKDFYEIRDFLIVDCEIDPNFMISTMRHIPDYLFRQCDHISDIIIPDTVFSVGKDVFWDSSLQTLELPEKFRNRLPEDFGIESGVDIIYREIFY